MKKITLLLLFVSMQNFAQVEIIENSIVLGSGKRTNNKIVFSRHTPEHGKEIWVSNGDKNNARLLLDIIPGPTGSDPEVELGYEIDDLVYFKANRNQIWRTDGTIEGTYPMFNNGLIVNPFELVKAGQFLYFRSEGKLWKMQSTPNSESLVTTVQTLNFSEISGLVKLDDDEILFNGKLSLTGKWGIYRSNGVRIELVRDINTATHPNASSSSNLEYAQMTIPKNIGGTIYFIGYSSEFQGELWKTDGTFAGTVMVKDISVNNTNPFRQSTIHKIFNKIGNNVYFSANDGLNGIELWKTSELTGNTEMIADINVGNNNNFGPDSFTEVNNTIYFTQNTSETPGNTQIWKTNGTEAGTIQITSLPTGYLSLEELFYKNNIIYFSLYSPALGMELWKLNTIDDTYSLVADIATGTAGSGPGGFVELNDSIYFSASSDGTLGGTKTYRISNQSLDNNKLTQNSKTHIYPNPTSNLLNIEIENASNFEAIIYDVVGKEVGTYKNQKTIDVTTLRNGIYFIKLKTDDALQTKTIKFIKK
jgi:ELWxxDGT repeat protein